MHHLNHILVLVFFFNFSTQMHSWFTFANLCLSEAWIHHQVCKPRWVYITLASPLDLSWFLIAFSSFFPVYMFLWVWTPKKIYINWYQSFGYLLGQASINQTHPQTQKTNSQKKLHKTSTVPNQKSGVATPCHCGTTVPPSGTPHPPFLIHKLRS